MITVVITLGSIDYDSIDYDSIDHCFIRKRRSLIAHLAARSHFSILVAALDRRWIFLSVAAKSDWLSITTKVFFDCMRSILVRLIVGWS
jgi:hypothetical protein